MATYTDNYALEKPTYAELADVAVLNRNMDKVDDVMHASQVSLAPAYDQNETYNTDDVVMYEMLMYKCLEDNVTGAWDGTKWERTTASECGGGGSIDFDIFGEGSGATVTITDGAEAGLAECIADIEATQNGSGTPSPSNVRPIVGRSEVNITVVGKNLCFNALGNINSPTDYLYPSGDGVGIVVNNTVRTAYAKVGKNTDYVFSCGTTPQRMLAYGLEGYPAVGVICHSLTVTQLSTTSYKFNSGNYEYIAFYYCNDLNNIPSNVMIEEGTTATAYEPYNGSVTTIPLGRTVYGGTLDVTRGILTVTWEYISSYNGESIPSEWISDRDEYQAGTTPTTGAGVAYKLTTPQTVSITPEEVSTILGYNNISADSGEVSVVYVKQTAPIKPNPTGADIPLKGIEIDGEKFSIPSGEMEIIPITAGDGTTVRTFTFSKTPKFIKIYWEDTVLDGGWIADFEIVWGQPFVDYKAHARYVSYTGLTGGCASIAYPSDNKSMIITGENAFGACNSPNGSGLMYIQY